MIGWQLHSTQNSKTKIKGLCESSSPLQFYAICIFSAFGLQQRGSVEIVLKAEAAAELCADFLYRYDMTGGV
jgi:deoxyribose-phosphate aldolase